MRSGKIIEKHRAMQMNPVVLAFIGDAVFSLYVREKLTLNNDFKSGKLSEMSAKVVSAKSQAKFFDEHHDLFTEEEADVFRRARNSKKTSRAKNSTVSEYNKSTGVEAVLGFLYLTGEEERLGVILATLAGFDGEGT